LGAPTRPFTRIGTVIIAKDRRPVDILSESDFIKLSARGCDVKEASTKEFMSRKVVTCGPSVTVIDVLIMRTERIFHPPVVKSSKLVGVEAQSAG